jgi:integrase/recombinase XerD
MKIYQRVARVSESGKPYMAYAVIKTGKGVKTGELTGPFYTHLRENGKQMWQLLTDAAGKRCEVFADAQKAAERQKVEMEAEEHGIIAPKAETPADDLAVKIESYLAETKANKSAATLAKYTQSLAYFVKSCRKPQVSQINREDMLNFKNYLKTQELSGRTIFDLFANVMIFIKWATGTEAQKATGVKPDDWPDKPERDPEEYSDEELEKILSAARTLPPPTKRDKQATDERLLLNSLLCSGLRSESELAWLTYGNVDFKYSLFKVRSTEDHKLKTDTAERDVPVPKWLTQKIADRKRELKRADSDLIFPNQNGEPNGHMLRIIKRVAKRAGVSGRVDDHKFRSTAITRWLRDGKTVPDIMAWVGHTDTETLLRYAAMLKLQDPTVHKTITQTFDRFATMGD